MGPDPLRDAREAYDRKAWRESSVAYAIARQDATLQLDDLDRYAVAAHLSGRNEESHEVLAQGYREAVRLGERPPAARFAFWIGHSLFFENRTSEAAGWWARARQLIADEPECVEHGYLLVPTGIEQIFSDDAEAGSVTFEQALEIARRCGDMNLIAIACHGLGRALIRRGLIAQGMAALDEAIVAVASGEVSPMAIGNLYCGVLEACYEVFDFRRAREWTGALTRWCQGQPDLVPYRGPCLVHRAELLQFYGEWTEALEEAERAYRWLSEPESPEGPADACYRIAELHRLRGAYAEAEEAYRKASLLGRQPEPGLPLLWLARGEAAAADAALRRALAEERGHAPRAVLLEAAVQVALARHDALTAREAASELGSVAAILQTPAARAMAATADGAAFLVEGDPRAALAPLRDAWTEWQRLDAPYDAARVRRLIATAYRDLGDHQSAAMEFDAARWAFQQLGAIPDVVSLDPSPAHEAPQLPGNLTAREVDVLRLLASGTTNKEIGAALVISEHTVARHVQNMLAKLGRSSRAALAAFAVEHGLASPTTQK